MAGVIPNPANNQSSSSSISIPMGILISDATNDANSSASVIPTITLTNSSSSASTGGATSSSGAASSASSSSSAVPVPAVGGAPPVPTEHTSENEMDVSGQYDKKGSRERFTKEQVQILDVFFHSITPHPTTLQIKALAGDIQTTVVRVRSWFAQKRTRDKKRRLRANPNILNATPMRLEINSGIHLESLKPKPIELTPTPIPIPIPTGDAVASAEGSSSSSTSSSAAAAQGDQKEGPGGSAATIQVLGSIMKRPKIDWNIVRDVPELQQEIARLQAEITLAYCKISDLQLRLARKEGEISLLNEQVQQSQARPKQLKPKPKSPTVKRLDSPYCIPAR